MSHVLADSQQHSFFADGLFIGASRQQMMPTGFVLMNQRQIENRSRECWSDMNCLIGSDAVRNDRGLYAELSLCVVSRDRVAGIEVRVWQQFRTRNHAVLLLRRTFDIGDLDVEILFHSELNSVD